MCAGVRNMIFILRNLSANNKNDLKQIMATGDVLLGLVLLLPLHLHLQLRIIMQISHGQRICKGQRVVSLTGCPYPCATPSLSALSPPSLPLFSLCYLPWHLFRFMSVRRIMANHLTSWHVCVTVCPCMCVCVGVCDILCPTRSPLVLAVIVGVARLATRRIRNIRLTRATFAVCLFVYLLCFALLVFVARFYFIL